jgi:hypothetical protein
MFERFTDRARRVLVLAQEEARLLNHNFIGTEHILLGLIHEGEGVAAKALESLGISLEAVREKVEETIGPAGTMSDQPPFTPRAKKVLELSLREALQLGHNYLGTEHMLLAIVREGGGVAAQVLVSLGADLSRVRQQVVQLLSGYAGNQRRGGQSPLAPRREALIEPGAGVAATTVPIDPAALVTWEDVEDLLRAATQLGRASVMAWDADGLDYRSCDYVAKALPSVTVSVAGADVSAEAFTRLTVDRLYEPIDGVEDAASFDDYNSTLRVLKGSVLFSIVVRNHSDPRAVAIALARKAGERLEKPA